jgi:CheY-like chemotaxis protein/HPt (histidine-containing phosphotransfer) domain-containing protein
LSAHIREFQVPQGRRIGIRLREATVAIQRARDQFVATMSHEIRTPLHGLMATLDMLRGEALSNEGRRQLGIARTSAKTLMRIANDVLDLTRISAGGMPIERKPMSIERLVSDVADEARSREEAARLRIAAQVGPEVPPAVVGDPLRIKQILRNLVSNALKFTSAGGVSIVAHWAGGICTIDVTDTGAGIAADQRESIFEAFVQADRSVSRRHGGAGLGLAIGRQLSEAMQGSLSLLHSGPSGSTFRLVLPLPETAEAPVDEQSQRNLPAVKGRILVAEDDDASRYVAQTLLESLECPARIVANGIDALEALRSGEFDLALMDCEMPGLDGYEVTSRVRQSGARFPIIAMTASTMSSDRKRCFDAGMDDLLPKPFGKAALSDMLAKWLAPQPRDSSQVPLAQELAKRPELDAEVFDELRQSLNWQIEPLKRIYVSVRESARLAIESLAGGAPADASLAHRRLHSLQGGAGLVGAKQIEYTAARLLKALKEGSVREVKEGIPLLLASQRRFDKVIEKRFDSLSAR